MENIVQSNNRDLRLVAVKVGVLSTLRLALPDVPANATRVEVIVTNGDTHTAYGAHLDTDTEHWLVDVAAAQFPSCGKQKYEISYLLDGKQFWDGAGWVTVEDATTGGITPSPSPDPARYVVTRINGYGAPNPDGEVRIPRTFVGTEDPTTTDGFIEFDQYFNMETGALFVLCSVGGELTWVQTAGAVFSVNGMVGAVEVQNIKINDEWRFSVAPGLSGGMAIRLEHLDFPSQGIWGVRTEMTIPTGLGTLAKVTDIPDVVAPSEDATKGQAADAKATHDALTGKLDSGEAILEKDAYGLTDGSRVAGFFVRKNGGIFIGTAGGIVEIPYLRPGTMALDVDISDATKLTPVFGEWEVSAVGSNVRIRNSSVSDYDSSGSKYFIINCEFSTLDEATGTWSGWDTYVYSYDAVPNMTSLGPEGNPQIKATRSIIGYKLAGDKASPVLLTDDAKAALFAGAAFREAVVDEIKSRPYIEQGEGGGIYVVIPETK